jgi:CheY-like chemotaxis protein
MQVRLKRFPVPRILVADDNTNIQKMVVLAFEERGIEVITVGNGEAAVRRLPDANPDLILADVFMPVRNGYEVCEFVKKDSRFAHVPVILLVGAFDPLDEKEARRVGADGVLKKPFVPPDPLIAMVMSALEKNPKVAAELAKAKETPAEVAPPPMPALEIPAKAEPKPLPDFPEPTAEEAAAIYGFGKGVRSLDDEEVQKASEPKAPVAEPEDQETEEFDGSSTANDWRRKSGMDLEIPDNVASEPAFSYGRDISPITFPSERDVPPRRIHVPDEAIEQQSAPQNAAPESASASKPEPTAVDDFFKSSVNQTVQPAESGAAHEHGQESLTQQAPESEHTLPARTGGWMDLMSSTADEHRERHWMTDARATEGTAPSVEAQASSQVPGAADQSFSPAPESSHQAADSEPQYMEDEQPKKKSWFTDAVEAVRDAVHSVVQDSAHDEGASEANHAIQEDIHEPAHEPAPEPVASAAPMPDAAPAASQEISADTMDGRFSYRDPGLEVPPAAHVTPEPLLVKDEPAGPSEYGKRFEYTPPMHSFMPPPPEEPMIENPSANGGSSFFEAAPPEPAFPGFGERIPTAPPPNREALAQIPFLTPPPPSMDSGKVDEGQVDAVVQRVLEKLEPQLHDLLSKGLLKPLIENMLQAELTKKDK